MNRILLNHKFVGQGPPVIFLHGLFGTMDNWLTMAKKLEANGYMAILLDQRDHGRSPHTDKFDYPSLANDLLHFMEDNWIHQSILIGHSMGGKAGLQFISQHPDMISKFVCIDIGTKQYPIGHKDVFNALFSVDLNIVTSREEVQQILMDRLHDLGTVLFLMKNLSRQKSGGFEWKLNLNLLFREYSNILAPILFNDPCETETLFIRGSRSPYIDDKDIPKLKLQLPNSRMVTIEDAGHWIHVDQPDELFRQIIHFIDE